MPGRLVPAGRPRCPPQLGQISIRLVAHAQLAPGAPEAVRPTQPPALGGPGGKPIADPADVAGPSDVRANLDTPCLKPSDERAHGRLPVRRIPDQPLELLLLTLFPAVAPHAVLASGRGSFMHPRQALVSDRAEAVVPLEG